MTSEPVVDPAVPRPCARPGCAESVVGTSGKGQLTRYHSRDCYRGHAHDKLSMVKDCANSVCKEKIRRKPAQSAYRFKQQRYHSRACAKRAEWSDAPEETKPCGYEKCDVVLNSRDYKSRGVWNKVQCCSNLCSNRMRVYQRTGATPHEELRDVEKICANKSCGAVFKIRDDERPSNFNRRQFCNVDCVRTNSFMQDEEDGLNEKECALPSCSIKFRRNPREARAAFTRRKFHSRECAYAGRTSGRRKGTNVVSYKKKPGPKPLVAKPGFDKQGNPLTVFGDVAPAEKWVPAAWRKSG